MRRLHHLRHRVQPLILGAVDVAQLFHVEAFQFFEFHLLCLPRPRVPPALGSSFGTRPVERIAPIMCPFARAAQRLPANSVSTRSPTPSADTPAAYPNALYPARIAPFPTCLSSHLFNGSALVQISATHSSAALSSMCSGSKYPPVVSDVYRARSAFGHLSRRRAASPSAALPQLQRPQRAVFLKFGSVQRLA